MSTDTQMILVGAVLLALFIAGFFLGGSDSCMSWNPRIC